jgi:hypothetical protein
MNWFRRIVLAVVTIFVAVTLPSPAAALAHVYDAPAVASADVHELGAVRAMQPQLLDQRKESVSPLPSAQGTSTTRFAPVVATEAAGGAVDDALAYATRAEKLDHIFVDKHNLGPLVEQFGSREAVTQQMLNGVRGLTPASGTFEIPVTIGGQTVVVRGAVVNGVTKLGTAFTP